jgi:hypothetical protein
MNSSTKKAAKPTPMDTSDSLEDRPTHPTGRTSSQASNNTPERSTSQNQTSSSSLDVVTTKEITLKKISDGLEKYFGSEGNVNIEGTSHGNVQMTFKHNTKYWMLRFPETFPNPPARLSSAFNPEHLSKMSPCSDFSLVKPLTNLVNVLLSIKNNCYGSCRICKTFTKENLAKPAAAIPPDNSKVTEVVNVLTNHIKMTLSTPLTFVSQAQNDGSNRIEFQHYHGTWSIEIPAEFPDKPAEVYKQERSHRDPEKKTINDSSKSKHKQKSLVSSDLIILAIRSNCYCSECYRI